MKPFPQKQHYRSQKQQINISYSSTPIHTLQQLNYPYPQMIKKLNLSHCQLESLKGIQRYVKLNAINIKFNKLTNPQQLMLIANKQNVVQLNFQGNDIQYHSSCRFISLRNCGFSNLKILNNKDYSSFARKYQKIPTIKKITKKLTQVQKSMNKTLKRAIKTNIISKYKLIPQIQQEQEQSNNENINNNNKKNANKKKQLSKSIDKQQHVLSCKKKQDSINQRNPLKDISLSNVNMIKSINRQISEDTLERGKNGPRLAIQPIQFNQNHNSHLPLTQPTATFASHRQRDSKAFRSRNHCKSSLSGVLQDEFECLGNQNQYQQLSQIIGNGQRPSLSIARSYAYENKSFLVEDLHDNVQDKMQSLATMVHLKSLLIKTFKALKPKNMPKKAPQF